MLGMATLTAVRSSSVMKNPRLSVTSTAQGSPCHLLMRAPLLVPVRIGGASALARGLEAPQPSVGVADGHLPRPEVGVLERRDHLDRRVGAERVRVGHSQRELEAGLP